MAATLCAIAGILKQRGIRLVFALASSDVWQEMYRSELTQLVGRIPSYVSAGEVVNAFRQKPGLR